MTTIGAGAFRNCTELQELILPESVTEIGDGAFRGCTGLTEVTILCDLALIPEDLFSDCSKLTKVTIANGAIPSGMFANLASLQEVTFGDGVTAIGDRGFCGHVACEGGPESGEDQSEQKHLQMQGLQRWIQER